MRLRSARRSAWTSSGELGGRDDASRSITRTCDGGGNREPLRLGEDALEENETSVVPGGVQLRIKLESIGGERKRVRVVRLACFLQGASAYHREQRNEVPLTLERRSSTVDLYSAILDCSLTRWASSEAGVTLVRRTPCCPCQARQATVSHVSGLDRLRRQLTMLERIKEGRKWLSLLLVIVELNRTCVLVFGSVLPPRVASSLSPITLTDQPALNDSPVGWPTICPSTCGSSSPHRLSLFSRSCSSSSTSSPSLPLPPVSTQRRRLPDGRRSHRVWPRGTRRTLTSSSARVRPLYVSPCQCCGPA